MAVNVVLKSVWDDRGIKSAQQSIANFNSKFDQAFKAVGVAAAAAGAAFALFAKQSITAASSLEESTNAVNVAFGKAADGILKIGETSAKSLGVARTEFNQAAVRFSAFAERIVGEGGDVAGFIQNITQRASDFASVFNIDVAEALQVFQSGLSGEAEPLKRFGINLLDTEVKAYALRAGIIGVGESLTETQKVQARYGLLLESTNKTAGDFANTSDSLANQQRILQATFTDLQAEIGSALLPVVGKLISQFADFLIPKLEQFGRWINSPDGKKAVNDFGDAIGNVLTAAFDFGDWFIKNFDTIKDFFAALVIGAITIRTLTGAIQVATGAMALFNAASAANIFIAAATALGFIAAGMFLVYQNTKKTTDAIEDQRIAILKSEDAFTTYATNGASAYKGLIPNLEYTTDAVEGVSDATKQTAREIGKLNTIKLVGLIAQANAAREAFRGFVFTDTGGTEGFLRNMFGTGPGGTAGAAPVVSQAQGAVENAFEKVRKFIKDAQEDVADAQEKYSETLAKAQQKYADAVLKTEADFAKRLADIIQQSQNRLRTAFESVVRVSLASIFEVEETRSVTNLIQGLSDRLRKSRQLLERAGELNAAGFSQTFIEQVVSAGVDTGNELAKAILDSTPATQRELQALFAAVEDTAETGMDSLAKEIYDKQGLATRELVNLYENTQQELKDTLKKLQEEFNNEVLDANKTLLDALKEIRKQFKENIASMDGDLGGLGKTVDAFINKLNSLIGAATGAAVGVGGVTGEVAPGTLNPPAAGWTWDDDRGGWTPPVGGTSLPAPDRSFSQMRAESDAIESVMKQFGLVGNQLMDLIFEQQTFFNAATNLQTVTSKTISAAERARLEAEGFVLQSVPAIQQATIAAALDAAESRFGVDLGFTPTQTVINVNVTTDATQSTAMVGKAIGNTINKYVAAGGGILSFE